MFIRNRKQLIDWLEVHAPLPTIRTALRDEGLVENFGAFSEFGHYGCWILQVSSTRFNKSWYVVVSPATYFCRHTFIIPTVDWKYWIGGISQLYQGDNPKLYKELKDVETE